MVRKSKFNRRFPRLITACAVSLLAVIAVLMSGCGGSSQSVISTGFPAGAGPFSLITPGAAAGDALTLTARNLPVAVFFPAPTAVANTDGRLIQPKSTTGGGLTFIPGTAYQLQKPTQPSGGSFPLSVILQITYPSAGGADPNTLNIYAYDSTQQRWIPVQPSAGQFQSQNGVIQTTLISITGSGLYAVMSSAPPVNP